MRLRDMMTERDVIELLRRNYLDVHGEKVQGANAAAAQPPFLLRANRQILRRCGWLSMTSLMFTKPGHWRASS